MKTKIKEIYEKFSGPLIIRAFASWSMAALMLLLLSGLQSGSLATFSRFGLPLVLGLIGGSFALLTVLNIIFKNLKTDIVILPVFFGLYSFLAAVTSTSMYTVFGLGTLWAILLFYYDKNGYLSPKDITDKKLKKRVILFAAIFVFYVGGIGVLRYLTFSTPNFDFGIFCNMYHNMRQSFIPVTTCERDMLLSHFSVHVSPIYYLLLPFYYVFPSGATLQICQTLILASGVIPVFMLSKHFGLKNRDTMLVCLLYALSPVIASGTNYDFHENCFLAPLLLWMFFFFEKEKYLPFALFAAQTLCVKEDAAVYVIFFALFMIFDRKKVLAGSLTGVLAAAYFAGAVIYLSTVGTGAMTGRFGNYMTAEGGLAEVIKNVLANPSFVLSQLFVSKDGSYGDKILFVLQMLLPLGLLPLNIKKPSRLLLVLPLLLINLMPVYVYQYSIGYQYSFGSFTFLFYLMLINLSENRESLPKWLMNTGAVLTALCFAFCVLPRHVKYVSSWATNSETHRVFNQVIAEIPKDKSVVCSTFLLPKLSNRDEIYELEYHDLEKHEKSDYVLFDMRYDYSKQIEQYKEAGYEITATYGADSKNVLIVMQPKEATANSVNTVR